MSDSPRAVCVLGMHRSGSSLAAQILAGNGWRTGRSQIGRSRFNRDGHLEDRFVVHTNKKLLLHFGGSWDRPPRLPEAWLDDSRVRIFQDRAVRYGWREIARAPYFFKDPRTALVIPFWREVFGPDLRFLVVLRNPAAVVRSLLRRQEEWLASRRLWWRAARQIFHRLQGAVEPLRPLAEADAEGLWHGYYTTIVRDLGDLAPSVLVYERLLACPEEQIHRLLSELSVPEASIDASMVKPTLSHTTEQEVAPAVAAFEQRLLALRRKLS